MHCFDFFSELLDFPEMNETIFNDE